MQAERWHLEVDNQRPHPKVRALPPEPRGARTDGPLFDSSPPSGCCHGNKPLDGPLQSATSRNRRPESPGGPASRTLFEGCRMSRERAPAQVNRLESAFRLVGILARAASTLQEEPSRPPQPIVRSCGHPAPW